MGDLPTVENKAAETTAAVIKGIVEVVISSAKAAAIAEAPFLKFPVISQIFDYLIGKMSSYLYIALANFGTFTVIDIQIGNELSNFHKAKDNLKEAIENGNKDSVADAKAVFNRSLASLIHWDGSFTPNAS